MRIPRLLLFLGSVAAAALYVRGIYRYRDPVRLPDAQPGAVLSPADGRVLLVRRVTGGRVEGQGAATDLLGWPGAPAAGWLLGLYAGPLDVHYLYQPVGGEVVRAEFADGLAGQGGTGAAAGLGLGARARLLLGQPAEVPALGRPRLSFTLRAPEGAEVTVALPDGGGQAETLSFLRPGDPARAGNKAAFAEGGGLVLVALPEGATPQVGVGDHVTGAETVLARLG
ncbi:phosphatidylserine decarboxylase [Deinococcus petrolearius]|uniref:Phosphatidylserine decarboxylase n=1 Tax=Deinococcus petrolearius TaxID=1751295 RepID=A0ABW1DFI2_9DEIO